MTSVTTEEYSRQQRLDAWKSIACYLGRTCRTVQRWHTDYGLPIHRMGGNKGPVFAYTNELDKWMRNRDHLLPDEYSETLGPVLLPPSIVRDKFIHRDEIDDLSLMTGAGKDRSSQLIRHAQEMWKCVSSTNMNLIVRFFREAVALDPYNAEALAGLSQALLVKCLWGGLHFSVAYPLAEAALQRALEINPESVEVKCVAAYFDLVAKRNWQAACRGFDEVLKHRSPTTRDLVGQALLRIAEGSQLEASGLLQEAMKLNALSSLTVALYCWNEYLAGECANAIDQVAQARASGQFGLVFDAVEALVSIQIEAPAVHIHRIEALVVESPLHDVLKGALGYAYGMAGQGQKAREILDALMCSGAQQKKCDPYAITLVLLGLNQRQEAVKWAEKSYREGSLWSFGFQSDLILASLRHDPHYRQFMSSVSYPAAENASLRLGSVG